jgi:hypothetical protein
LCSMTASAGVYAQPSSIKNSSGSNSVLKSPKVESSVEIANRISTVDVGTGWSLSMTQVCWPP